jgi:hypothetical protein
LLLRSELQRALVSTYLQLKVDKLYGDSSSLFKKEKESSLSLLFEDIALMKSKEGLSTRLPISKVLVPAIAEPYSGVAPSYSLDPVLVPAETLVVPLKERKFNNKKMKVKKIHKKNGSIDPYKHVAFYEKKRTRAGQSAILFDKLLIKQ